MALENGNWPTLTETEGKKKNNYLISILAEIFKNLSYIGLHIQSII